MKYRRVTAMALVLLLAAAARAANPDDAAPKARVDKGDPQQKISLPQDPWQREAAMERIRKQQAAQEKKTMQKAAAHGLQWDGSKFVPAAKPEDKVELARQTRVCDLLSAKERNPLSAIELIPNARLAHYQWLLSNREYVCVGWHAEVAKVDEGEDGKDGKTFELIVRPTLATKEGRRTVFTPYRVKETWRLDARNQLTCEKSEPVAGDHKFVLVD